MCSFNKISTLQKKSFQNYKNPLLALHVTASTALNYHENKCYIKHQVGGFRYRTENLTLKNGKVNTINTYLCNTVYTIDC